MAQRKKKLSEREGAEKRYQALIEKRDEMNEEANQVRSERNTLNETKRKLLDEMKEVKARRNDAAKEMKAHRKRRDEAQKKAKQLISFKRQKLGNLYKDLPREIEAFRADIQFLEMKQQTSVMTLRKENDLLDQLRAKQREIPRMEKLLNEQETILKEIDDMDKSITELFKVGDEEHEKVVEWSKVHQELHDKYMDTFHEVSHLTIEANKKHELFLKVRERADLFHQKAQEMRKKVIALKKEANEERMVGRRLVNEQNKLVKMVLLDEKKLDQAADDAVKELFRKGKIEM